MKKYFHFVLLSIITVCLFFAIYTFVNDNNGEVDNKKMDYNNEIKLIINEHELIVELEDNEAVSELLKRLKYGSLIINANDYGNFEKVGELGFSLPTSDKTITTTSGDIMLYQGDKICLYYDRNTYSFTKLGHIKDITEKELKNVLGEDDITYKLSLKGE
jgi:hypothetical protein